MRKRRLKIFLAGVFLLAVCSFSVPTRAADTEETCAHSHTEVQNEAEATCRKKGYTGDVICTDCGKRLSQGETVQKLPHTYVTTVKKATKKKAGSIKKTCSSCGKTASKKKIEKIRSVTLSRSRYVYNGKEKTPSVKVLDAGGNRISSRYYTVTYKKNTKVGRASVTVKFRGRYQGSVIKNFKISPKPTRLSSLTARSKGFTVTWKKRTEQVSGYQIQYATDSKFKKNQGSVRIENNKTTSAAIPGLKGKQKYYVRIRTFKTRGGKDYYSPWSRSETVSTKEAVTVFVGDSITYGLYPKSLNCITKIHIGGGKKIVAYSGLATYSYLSSKYFSGKTGIEQTIAYQPSRVYFMFGMNEATWRKNSDVIADYEKIVKRLQRECPGIDIVILPCPPVTTAKAGRMKKINAYNQAVKAWAQKAGVAYYDITSEFKNANGYLKGNYTSGDGVHWSFAAYTKFGELITAYDKDRG